MYIALKWLFGMVLTMWIALCSLDIYQKKSLTKKPPEYGLQKLFTPFHNNTSFKFKHNFYEIQRIKIPNEYPLENIYLQYLIFLAGICMVAIFTRKNDIIYFTKRGIINFNFEIINDFFQKIICLKQTAKYFSIATLKYSKIVFIQLFKIICSDIRFILLNKSKNYQQSLNLSQLLITDIQENKKMGKQKASLETCVKCSATQVIKNQSQNISFQQLYLISHQENVFLKLRIKKLTKEKEDAERKLIKLINQVCQSKNSDLKAYCSQFIVHTKNNLLNSDVKAEIDKFLRKSSVFIQFQANNQFSEQTIQHCNINNVSIKSTEITGSENLITEEDNAPEFRAAPGEYVWTVKDKEGIIEKLYEYGNDFTNGDMVKRIRQYSVYYDTECLLDFSNSTTFINKQDADISNIRSKFTNIKVTETNRRFLSSSTAFKSFLENSKSIMAQRSKPSDSCMWLST